MNSNKRSRSKNKQKFPRRGRFQTVNSGLIKSPNQLIRAADNQIYEVVQSAEFLAQLSSSASVPTYGSIYTTLQNFDQYTDFAPVFDQYRIVEVEVSFFPRIQTVDGQIVNAGLFHSVVDYDDSASLTSVASALDYTNCLVTPGNKMHRRTFVPHVALAAYAGAFTSYANVDRQWIDCSSSTVQHYGIKTAWTTTSIVLTMDVVVRARIQFRNVR